MMSEDLHALRDDMHAFILGHGMHKFQAYVTEDMQTVIWDAGDNADAWKDFVELAKASGISFVTVSDDSLAKEDLEFLQERLQNSPTTSDEEIDEARWLRTHVGKVGFLQLGFSYQGTIFLYEVATDWYERYQQLLESGDDFGSLLLDEHDQQDDDDR
ncbi:MAG: hypothetical protein JWO13_2118 [Acidobacteriales bacterium]|nr:hypothetical protein [Terriglobales bacterium]